MKDQKQKAVKEKKRIKNLVHSNRKKLSNILEFTNINEMPRHGSVVENPYDLHF